MKKYNSIITFLGTGAGTPTKTRSEAGILISSGSLKILIDPGSAIIERLLKINVTYHDITHIVISHLHPDHVQGLISFLFSSKFHLSPRRNDLIIIAPKGFRRFLNKLQETFDNTITPEFYKLNIHEASNKVINFKELKITFAKTLHSIESIGYRFHINGRIITYSGDTGYCQDIIDLSKHSDILILECSMPDKFKVKNHLTPSLAGKIASQSGSKILILTHFFPICEKFDILSKAHLIFKGKIVQAYDFMSIKI